MRRHFTYANVMATMAMFIALSTGGAWAATQLITGKQIRDGSVTGRDIRNGSITWNDMRGTNYGLFPKGSVAGGHIKRNSIHTYHIRNSTIRSADLAGHNGDLEAVAKENIRPSAVTSRKVKDAGLTIWDLSPTLRAELGLPVVNDGSAVWNDPARLE